MVRLEGGTLSLVARCAGLIPNSRIPAVRGSERLIHPVGCTSGEEKGGRAKPSVLAYSGQIYFITSVIKWLRL